MNTPYYFRETKTATTDAAFKVVTKDIWLYYADVFVLTNNAYMGDVGNQDIPILANDIYTFPTPVNINDLFFKNYGAGLNTNVIITGMGMSDADIKTLLTVGKFALRQ